MIKLRVKRKAMEYPVWESAICFNDYRDGRLDWVDFYRESIGLEDDEEVDMRDVYDWAVRKNDEELEDLKLELNIDVGNRIIAFTETNVWDGRYWAMNTVGTNVSDIFKADKYNARWYSDGDDIRSIHCHHVDGADYILYRILKDETLYSELYKWYSKAHDSVWSLGEVEEIVRAYTNSLVPYVSKAFIW